MMAEAPLVLFEVHDGVARIRLNRPDRLNALDFAVAEHLLAALKRADADNTAKAVTLTGEGRSFMAGGDLSVFQQAGDKAPEVAGKLIGLFHEIVLLIRTMKPPVVAGVQGAVAGGGLGLALACDLVIAADDAKFVPAYTRLGTNPDGGTTWSITRLIGKRRAMEWSMLGDPMSAEEAARIGLINRAVPAAKLAEEIAAYAKRIADGPAFAFASVKKLVNDAPTSTFEQQLDAERTGFMSAAATADFREGIAAFFERRPAKFGTTEE
jgi:2-(1,2-epoxy-1,2-dihydrophenyl)acetyl-CoA isomerase